MNVTQLLSTYGYGTALLFMTIESMGIPDPRRNDTAHRCYCRRNDTPIGHSPFVIVAAASGAILGENLGFWIGREGGYHVLRSSGRFVRLDGRKLKLGQYLFLKHGGKVVFARRALSPSCEPGRPRLSRTNHMRWSRFLLFNASGGYRIGQPGGTGQLFSG